MNPTTPTPPRMAPKVIHDVAAAAFRKSEGRDFEGVQPWAASAIDAATAPLLAALAHIAKGEGPYSRDRYTHAANTIDAMKQLAVDAIAKATGEQS